MRLLFVCLIIVSSASLRAQERKPYENLPKTPDAALFSRIETNTAVEGSGASSVDIALGNVEVTGVSIPLLLQYSNTGIRVTDIETSVGLGWVLNVGGMITRTVSGIPDEYGWLLERPNFEKSCRTQSMLKEYYDKLKDTSPDIFSYSINGKSGYFYFNENGVLVKSLSSDAVKITYTTGVGGLLFCIVDENGVTYKYEASEVSSRRATGFIGSAPAGDYLQYAPTAWKLTEIITPSNEKIALEYEDYNVDTPMFISAWNFTTSLASIQGMPNSTEFTASKCIDSYHIKLLKKITSKYKTFLFNYADDSKSALMKKKLVSVKSYDPIGNNPLADISLSYHVSDLNSRLFLDTVKFNGIKKIRAPQVYTFDYNRNTFEFGTIRKDLFGYYSQKFTEYGFPYNKGTGAGYPSVQSYIAEVDRSVDDNSILFSTLKKVTYPTGAFVEYILEPNVVKSTNQNLASPGLRLKGVNYYNSNAEIVKSQDFSYGNITTNVFNGSYVNYYSGPSYWDSYPPRSYKRTVWSTEPIIGERSLIGSCYSFIKVTDKVYSPTRGVETFFTVNTYDNFFGVDHLKSFLKRKDYFKGDGQKVRSETHNYASRASLSDVKYWELPDAYVFVGSYTDCDGATYCSYGGKLCDEPTVFYPSLTPAYLITGVNEIYKSKEQVVEYTQKGDSIVSYKKYEYNPLMQISKQIENQSYAMGRISREKISDYKYASDYDDALAWIKNMKRLNIIGKPLDIRRYIIQPNSIQIVDANLFEYNAQGLLTKEYRYNYKGGLSQWNGSLFLPQNFDKIAEYQYDLNSFNLVQQINRSNVATSYLWGYRGLYPIVKVENVDISTLTKLVGSNFDSYTTDNQILALANKVKNKVDSAKVLANIFASTFIPGIGLNSYMDQKGEIKYYSYDDFGRLESVKNKDNHLLASYDYRYYNDKIKNDKPTVFLVDTNWLSFDGKGANQIVVVDSTKPWTILSKSSSFIQCRKLDNQQLEVGCASYSVQGNRTGTIVLTNGEKELTIDIFQTSAIDE